MRQVPPTGSGRRLSFDAILPLLALPTAEVETEFARVCSALRCEELSRIDFAPYTRMHRLSCRMQAASHHRSRLV